MPNAQLQFAGGADSAAHRRYVSRKRLGMGNDLAMSETTKIAPESDTGIIAPSLIEPQVDAPAPRAAEAHGPGWLEILARPLFAIPSLTIFSVLIFFVNL